ncbi:MAG: glycosyltransferase domain-containing protein [Pseudomonadota bacterium]
MKIFFSSRQARRVIALEKYGEDLRPHCSHGDQQPAEAAEVWPDSPSFRADVLQEDWYADVHGLDCPTDALEHYQRYGACRALAPNPDLADPSGVVLAHWAVEFLVRAGVPIGALGAEELAPDDRKALNPYEIENPNGKKIAVVTAIFGRFDRLMPIDPAWQENADFFAFSDSSIEMPTEWKLVHGVYYNEDPRRRARFAKLHLPTFFSGYDWVVWIDGNILLCEDPKTILEHLNPDSFDFITFKHPDRSSIVAEAAACITFNKEDGLVLASHLKQHQDHPAFRDENLYETMVLFLRPSSSHVQDMCAKWWRSIMRGSKRDQLSLPLAIADTQGLRVGHLPDSIARSPFFAKIKHTNE